MLLLLFICKRGKETLKHIVPSLATLLTAMCFSSKKLYPPPPQLASQSTSLPTRKPRELRIQLVSQLSHQSQFSTKMAGIIPPASFSLKTLYIIFDVGQI